MKAFPTVNWVQQKGQPPNDEGMDLRDYFAIQIVNAILSCQGYLGAIPLIETLPKDSYKWADAMIKARSE
jgi:hypothetical protein